MLGVLAKPDVAQLEHVIFRETGTLGVQCHATRRTAQPRRTVTVETAWGPIAGVATEFDGTAAFSPEYEDCRRIATVRNLPLRDVIAAAQRGVGRGEKPELEVTRRIG